MRTLRTFSHCHTTWILGSDRKFVQVHRPTNDISAIAIPLAADDDDDVDDATDDVADADADADAEIIAGHGPSDKFVELNRSQALG
jgi:hypothetical protein